MTGVNFKPLDIRPMRACMSRIGDVLGLVCGQWSLVTPSGQARRGLGLVHARART